MSCNKIICAICYEDAKPSSEELQSISICGHVFHELCLQQWLEYCPRGRNPTCPLCKQPCSSKDVHRLYFQSSAEATQVKSPQILNACEDVESLQATVEKLTGQLSVTKASLLASQEQLQELNGQLSSCAVRAEKAESAHREANSEKANLKDALSRIQEELKRSTSERCKLLEKNTSMTKELASYKLVENLDMNEDEVARLARVGCGANKDDVICTLTRSLVMRNRTYKELMARCNELGMGESRALRKSEKAAEHIRRMKARLQDLEKSLEAKENGDLRFLKSCPCSCRKDGDFSANQFQSGNNLGASNNGLKSSFALQSSSQTQKFSTHGNFSNREIFNLENDLMEQFIPSKQAVHDSFTPDNSGIDGKFFHALENDDLMQPSASVGSKSEQENVIQNTNEQEFLNEVLGSSASHHGALMDRHPKTTFPAVEGDAQLRTGSENGRVLEEVDLNKHENVGRLLSGSVMENQFSFDIHMGSSFPLLIRKEGKFLTDSGGEMESNQTMPIHSDTSTSHFENQISRVSKWCKPIGHKENGSTFNAQVGGSTGTFISFGADGRGGQVKVLKPPRTLKVNSSSSQSLPRLTKRCKRSSSVRHAGKHQSVMQMEHFFDRTNKMDCYLY